MKLSEHGSEAGADTAEENVPAACGPRKRRPGRPLSFDRAAALERAMLVFWRLGYEAASVKELTAAMGITPPSLYAAFGDKERLFLEALEHYEEQRRRRVEAAVAEAPTAREAVARWLEEAARELVCPSHPKGCMLVTTAPRGSEAAAGVQALLAGKRAASEASLEARIRRGMAEGELPAATDAAALAGFYTTVVQGMSIQALDGASAGKLCAVVDAALRAWPPAPGTAAPGTASR
jgi:AcrR family transcriptional regulator